MPVYEVFVDGKLRRIELTKRGEDSFSAKLDDKTISVQLPSDKIHLETEFSLKIDGKAYAVKLPRTAQRGLLSVIVEEATFKAEVKTPTRRPARNGFEPARTTPMKRATAARQVVEGAVVAPMTGRILSVMVKEGNNVKSGQVLCILEAMKMENEITAPWGGTVKEIHVSEGSSVSEGDVLLVVA